MVLTRCATVDAFVRSFRMFCDGTSLFVPTRSQRRVGLEAPFSFQLIDGTPVLCGVGVVLEVFTTADNAFHRPGLLLRLAQLAPESVSVHVRLQPAKKAAKAAPAPAPAPRAKSTPGDGTPLSIDDVDLFDRTGPIASVGHDGAAPLVEVAFVAPPTVTFTTRAKTAPEPPAELHANVVEEPARPVAPPPAPTSHRRQLIIVGALSALGGAAIALATVTIAARHHEPDAAVTMPAPRTPVAPSIPRPPAAVPAVEAAVQPVAPAPAVERRCTLSIAATPSDAEIRVGGRSLGTSPVFFVGPCESAVVEVSRKRYETTTQTVMFDDGDAQTLTVRLKRPARRVSAALVPSS